MLNANSPMPLYHQLAEILLGEIRSGRHAVGARIPSENELAARYGIGRPTVRQAIGSLVRRGVLIRRRGSGTFVASQPETVNLFSLTGTLRSLKSTGCELAVALVTPPARGHVEGDPANPFDGRAAVAMTRLSRLDGAPVLVEDIYLDPKLFPGIENLDLAGQSLSGLVEDHYGLALASADQHFRITWPDDRLGRLLELPATTPILTVHRHLHFASAENGVYSTLFCRTDQFIFSQHIGDFPHV